MHKVARTSLFLLLLIGVAGCANLQAGPMVGVDVTSVNYTDQYYSSVLQDPVTGEAAGGESVNPFGAGGSMCCYSLPAIWRPNIKVKVRVLLPVRAKNYEEYKTEKDVWVEKLVEIPPYPSGRPATLWTVITPGPKVEVVSSAYDPSNAKWPGSIKGWPVPSLEYRRKLWDRKVVELRETLANSTKLLSDPHASDEIKRIAASNYKFYSEQLKYYEKNKP